MANHDYSKMSFTRIYATTAAPQFVSSALTPDTRLEAKTVWVVLAEQQDGTVTASVYRQSSKVPDSYSRDVYVWSGKEWEYRGKDQQKYKNPPAPPSDASRTLLEGLEVYTMQPLNENGIKRLRQLIKAAG